MAGSSVLDLVRTHDRYRAEGVNLVASENWVTPAVRRALGSDLGGRYADPFYGGSRHAQAIRHRTEELARETFDADHAYVTPLSGNVCDLALLHAFTDPGDGIAMVPFAEGGYPLNNGAFDRGRIDLPLEEATPRVDADPAADLVAADRPPLTLLGASLLPFPHPVEAVAEAAPEGTTLAYDGSHVLGLLATGAFQDPLAEGADVLVGSTHKSLPGPQGGLVVTDDDVVAEALEVYLELDVERGIGLVDNTHPHEIAALGVALEELREHPDYGERVQENSKTLALALDEAGVPVAYADHGYTESHQVALDLDPERASELCDDLGEVGIYVDRMGRVGTAEPTWRGLEPSDLEELAGILAEVEAEGPSRDLEKRAQEVAARQRGYDREEGDEPPA
jgi:glycine hydroxymethyltransferase